MRYALLIYPVRPVEEFERLPEEEQQAIRAEFLAPSSCSPRRARPPSG
jgi:hypothetical protein